MAKDKSSESFKALRKQAKMLKATEKEVAKFEERERRKQQKEANKLLKKEAHGQAQKERRIQRRQALLPTDRICPTCGGLKLTSREWVILTIAQRALLGIEDVAICRSCAMEKGNWYDRGWDRDERINKEVANARAKADARNRKYHAAADSVAARDAIRVTHKISRSKLQLILPPDRKCPVCELLTLNHESVAFTNGQHNFLVCQHCVQRLQLGETLTYDQETIFKAKGLL